MRTRYLHPGNDFELETGLKIGESVVVVCEPDEGFLTVGQTGTIEDVNFDAAGWYVNLSTDEDGPYRVWEIAPNARNDGNVYF